MYTLRYNKILYAPNWCDVHHAETQYLRGCTTKCCAVRSGRGGYALCAVASGTGVKKDRRGAMPVRSCMELQANGGTIRALNDTKHEAVVIPGFDGRCAREEALWVARVRLDSDFPF